MIYTIKFTADFLLTWSMKIGCGILNNLPLSLKTSCRFRIWNKLTFIYFFSTTWNLKFTPALIPFFFFFFVQIFKIATNQKDSNIKLLILWCFSPEVCVICSGSKIVSPHLIIPYYSNICSWITLCLLILICHFLLRLFCWMVLSL